MASGDHDFLHSAAVNVGGFLSLGPQLRYEHGTTLTIGARARAMGLGELTPRLMPWSSFYYDGSWSGHRGFGVAAFVRNYYEWRAYNQEGAFLGLGVERVWLTASHDTRAVEHRYRSLYALVEWGYRWILSSRFLAEMAVGCGVAVSHDGETVTDAGEAVSLPDIEENVDDGAPVLTVSLALGYVF